MKHLEDIEKMSLEELEAIGKDSSIKVPDGLDAGIRASLLAAAVQNSESAVKKQRRTSGWSPLATRISTVAAIAFASLIVVLSLPQQPKDTFDDPALAYAELEKAFALIGDKAGSGIKMASQFEDTMDRTLDVFNK